MSKKRIFVLTFPYSGHVNPICGVVTELQTSGAECIVYSGPKFREIIEKTGAQFREYVDCRFTEVVLPKITIKERLNYQVEALRLSFDAGFQILPQLIKDYETDQPNLVFFDSNFAIARYLYWNMQKKGKPIKIVEFYPNFVISKEIFKKKPDTFPKGFDMIALTARILTIYIKLSWTFSLGFRNPFKVPIGEDDALKIVAVFPELHPDIESYDATHKFVGQCVAEETRAFDLSTDPELKALLESFPIKGDNYKADPTSPKLILMTLGTVFNINDFIFEHLIKDICDFDKKPERHFKASQFKIILGVGNETLAVLTSKKEKGELEIPSNFLLRSFVPQLEILKRADLFITHCGMNSISETIKYGVPIIGVPIIGVPIEADQPFVAERVCDQLQMGVWFEPLKIKPGELGDAVDKVLSQSKFRDNVIELSKKSDNYNGKKEAAKLILEMIN